MRSKISAGRLGCVAGVLCAVAVLTVVHTSARGSQGRGSGPIIYVSSQDLYYDSIVGPDLPPYGPFQLLEMTGATGLQTQYGPGDPGYVGGRWWVDADGDGEMSDGDAYFSCPLLGPGRKMP